MGPCLRGRIAVSLSACLACVSVGGAAFAQAPATAPYAPPPPSPLPAPAADAPPAPMTLPLPPATTTVDPQEEVLRRLLRSGCHDGLREARQLAASGGAPWAETVTRLCGEILRAQPATAPLPPRLRAERDGRGTIVVYSTFYGIWVGVATDVLFSIDNVRGSILPPLLGMGGGLALSLALTSERPITNGQAWAIATGMDYGTINGALWAGAFNFKATDVVGTALATGVASTAAGLLVATQLAPKQGDVEVVRSSLLWGGLGGLFGIAAFGSNPSDTTYFRGMAVAQDLAFLGGLAISSSFDVSRTRDLIIDAGTLGGAVAGLGVTVLALGTNGTRHAVFAGGLLGMTAGMVTAILLTRDMDSPDEDQGSPVAALVGRDARGRWRLGSPGASPVFDGLGRRVVGATFTALGGAF
ncbi:MAG TPA: hypothetical protein VHL80_07790 [Polyangia bacterium]|nr:hypothetical protein [Polyangia bacterium]